MSAVADLHAHLVAEGLVDGSSGWPSVRRRMHDETDRLVVLTEDGGFSPEIGREEGVGSAAYRDPAVMVTVRGGPWDGDASAAQAEGIFQALHGLTGVTMGATLYLRVQAQTAGAVFVGFDDRGRPLHTISFRMARAAVNGG